MSPASTQLLPNLLPQHVWQPKFWFRWSSSVTRRYHGLLYWTWIWSLSSSYSRAPAGSQCLFWATRRTIPGAASVVTAATPASLSRQQIYVDARQQATVLRYQPCWVWWVYQGVSSTPCLCLLRSQSQCLWSGISVQLPSRFSGKRLGVVHSQYRSNHPHIGTAQGQRQQG